MAYMLINGCYGVLTCTFVPLLKLSAMFSSQSEKSQQGENHLWRCWLSCIVRFNILEFWVIQSNIWIDWPLFIRACCYLQHSCYKYNLNSPLVIMHNTTHNKLALCFHAAQCTADVWIIAQSFHVSNHLVVSWLKYIATCMYWSLLKNNLLSHKQETKQDEKHQVSTVVL